MIYLIEYGETNRKATKSVLKTVLPQGVGGSNPSFPALERKEMAPDVLAMFWLIVFIIANVIINTITLALVFRTFHETQIIRRKLRLMGYKLATEDEKQEYFDKVEQNKGFDG